MEYLFRRCDNCGNQIRVGVAVSGADLEKPSETIENADRQPGKASPPAMIQIEIRTLAKWMDQLMRMGSPVVGLHNDPLALAQSVIAQDRELALSLIGSLHELVGKEFLKQRERGS